MHRIEAQSSAPLDIWSVHACRACGAEALADVLSLGSTPLANSLLATAGGPSPVHYPLDLKRCTACSLVQLGQIVSPEKLFSKYVYYSSFSDTMVEHAEQLALDLQVSERLGSKSLVVEIASNDGYLLQFLKRAGI